jgi:monovalent cation:proton antiporter-2 (CPA2) family protein
MNHGFFFHAFVYLAAALVMVPIAKRLGLGSVLGYLLAGAVIGPHVFGLVGEEGEEVMHFAEFGVVMMLFLIGLELQPPLLWKLRHSIFGLGGLQVILTGAAGCGIGMALGLTWQMSLATGLILAMSSTAIVLQTLGEKGLLKTPGGQASFSVLLFQDIAVIPILALLPLLAYAVPEAKAEAHGALTHIPPLQKALFTLGAVTAIVLAGRYLLRPVFRVIAATRLRELFTAMALLLVVGITILMEKAGLSPALGAFLGGVVMANSEYRHELESDIEPFKGLLLGLFFISVGALIDFGLVASDPLRILGLVFLLLAVKVGILAGLGWLFRMPPQARLLFALGLAQGGEFAFVLLSFAVQNSILSPGVASPLVAAVALSMAVTPLLFLAHDALVKRLPQPDGPAREADAIDEENPVIIAGYGRFGTTVGRYLRSHGIGCTVLDLDPEQVDILRRIGMKVYYGDASRLDLLRAAGAERAKMLVVAVDDPVKMKQIVETARRHFPHLELLVRAPQRSHAYELIHDGVQHVYREVFDSALVCADDAYRILGGRAYRSARDARYFRRHDEKLVREMAKHWGDDKHFYAAARKAIAEEEELLKSGLGPAHEDHAWDNDSLRAEVGPRTRTE